MDELQISKILFRDKSAKNNFVGVYSRTKIPLSMKFPASYIINLDEYGNKGTHWISVYITNKYINVFCSFGNNYLYDNMLLSFFNYFPNRKFICNHIQIQSFQSVTCGLYSCLFILLLSRGYTFKQYLNIFDFENLVLNDKAITYFFERKYKIKLLKM